MERLPRFHPKLRSYWELRVAEEGGCISFRDVAPERLPISSQPRTWVHTGGLSGLRGFKNRGHEIGGDKGIEEEVIGFIHDGSTLNACIKFSNNQKREITTTKIQNDSSYTIHHSKEFYIRKQCILWRILT